MATEQSVTVPDIGNYKDVQIIEVLVAPGDTIKAEDSLITLESDKAAMEIPSPYSGTVKAVTVKVGDKVSQGTPILTMVQGDSAGSPPAEEAKKEAPPAAAPAVAEAVAPAVSPAAPAPAPQKAVAPVQDRPMEINYGIPHASPSVRRFARELGADVARIKGSGPKGRILKEDVQTHIKTRMQAPEGGGLGLNLPSAPAIDFAQFGAIQAMPLSRIKKLTGVNLHRNWVSIPHVTLNEDADITELEAFRVGLKGEAEKQGVRVTLLPFLIKAVIAALKAFPTFNASLSADGEALILKQYYHIGVAIDTPDGLVVPPLKDADSKGIFVLAKDLAELGERARGKKLRSNELQGGTFTISSLGGIGSTSFTPIINAPEVAILGVSKAQMKQVYRNNVFEPRLILPLSLSFDHRVIDGAEAARFCAFLAQALADMRRVLL